MTVTHQHHRELPEPGLERGLGGSLAETQGDASEGGGTAGADHHRRRGAGTDHGSHQGAGGQVEGPPGVAHGLDPLFGRHRLSGEHRLVALQPGRLEQAQVGGHDVTDVEVDDVAGDEQGDVELLDRTAAGDGGAVADLRVQLLDRPLGSVLVHEPQAGAETHDDQDDDRVRPLSDGERHHRGHHQQDQQRAVQLSLEHRERAASVAAYRVGAELLQAPRRLPLIQPLGAAAQPCKDVGGGERGGIAQGGGVISRQSDAAPRSAAEPNDPRARPMAVQRRDLRPWAAPSMAGHAGG
jgi:hypothetical protein